MSRTWKDKHKTGLGSVMGSAFRKKRIEESRRVAAAKKTAKACGFSCTACFIMDQMQKGATCSEHGGGIRAALRKAGKIP
jgi:hypothetical protein